MSVNKDGKNDIDIIRTENSLSSINSVSENHSCLFGCLIRFIFVLIIFILILVTSFFYALDIFFQGSCRLIHDDHLFVISLITGKQTISNEFLRRKFICLIDRFTGSIKNFDVNQTTFDVIDHCEKKIHFTETFLINSSKQLNDQLTPIITNLNGKIFEQFSNNINKTNFDTDLQFLINLANSTGLTDIANHIRYIQKDFKQIDQIFKQIVELNSTLPSNFIKTTVNQVTKTLAK
jgi:hypothetical protein